MSSLILKFSGERERERWNLGQIQLYNHWNATEIKSEVANDVVHRIYSIYNHVLKLNWVRKYLINKKYIGCPNIQISGERDEIHAKFSSAIIEIHNFREENYSHERGISEIANDVHSTSHILDFQPCIEIEMAHLRGSNSPQGICSRFPDPQGMKKCNLRFPESLRNENRRGISIPRSIQFFPDFINGDVLFLQKNVGEDGQAGSGDWELVLEQIMVKW